MKKDIFVVGDIHGHATELKILINKLPLDQNSLLIFLGDYIDRGPASKEVINTILALKEKFEVITLMGNHEKMFLDFYYDVKSEEAASFYFNGGNTTLQSYAINEREYEIPQEHLDFFNNLLMFYETPEYFFVHAGVPDIPLEDIDLVRDQLVLLWVRESFFNSNYQWGKTIIHGHTVVENVEISPTRINLDTGLVYDGKLSAMHVDSREIYSVQKRPVQLNTYLKTDFSDRSRRSKRMEKSFPVYVVSQNYLFQFETRNISEVGLLISEVEKIMIPRFSVGDILHGQVGTQLEIMWPFDAEVIRVFQHEDYFQYGLSFLNKQNLPKY